MLFSVIQQLKSVPIRLSQQTMLCPTEQLYELVTVRTIEHTQNLHILSFVQHTAHTLRNGFSTWVPQWHLGPLSEVIDWDSGSSTYYDAAAGSRPYLASSADHGVLRLHGLAFDVVCSCLDRIDKDAIELLGPENFQIADTIIVNSLATQVASGDLRLVYPQAERLEALSLTLVVGLCRLGLSQHLADFAAYRKHVCGINRTVTDSTEEISQPRKDVEGGDWYRFARGAADACHNRRLLVTRKGYLGLGPEALQEDDLCCISYGARVPFILRRHDDHYLLIGESYIHGIMRGEAMKTLRIGELQEKMFEIH